MISKSNLKPYLVSQLRKSHEAKYFNKHTQAYQQYYSQEADKLIYELDQKGEIKFVDSNFQVIKLQY